MMEDFNSVGVKAAESLCAFFCILPMLVSLASLEKLAPKYRKILFCISLEA
jgi:hypothetical protein